jgi:hypothetical protein
MRIRCGVKSFLAAASFLSMKALSEGEYSIGCVKGSIVL